MARNFLWLNDDKTTEFLIIGNKPHLEKGKFRSILNDELEIKKSSTGRHIGAIFDENLNMEKHMQIGTSGTLDLYAIIWM